jgi:hypothetical protein
MKRKLIILLVLLANVCLAQKNMPTKVTLRKKGHGTEWIGEPKYISKYRQPFDGVRLVGFGGGTANYYGDFTSYKLPAATILKTTRWNFTGNYTKYFTHRFGMRLGLSIIRIMGDDANFENGSSGFLQKYSRGLHFRNTLKEGALVGIFDFTNYNPGGFTRRSSVIPYILGGIALANHNPQGRDEAVNGAVSKDWLKLRQFDTEGQSDLGQKQYSTVALSVPVGFGFKFKISPNFDFQVEGRLNYTFNRGGKYLDDVAENYIATAASNTFPSNSERFSYRADEVYSARTGKVRNVSKITPPPTQDINGFPTARGNGRQDIYFLTAFQINYFLPAQIRCKGNN